MNFFLSSSILDEVSSLLAYCIFAPYFGTTCLCGWWFNFLSLCWKHTMVVPIQCDVTVLFCFPIFCYCVVFLQDLYQVFGMLVAHIFDSKVICNERETHGAPFMLPKPRCFIALEVTCFVQALFQQLLSDYHNISSGISLPSKIGKTLEMPLKTL